MWQETIPRVIAGVVLLVLGWQLYRFGIHAIGFYFGFMIGAAVWGLVLALTEGKVDLPQGEAADLAAGIVLGTIGAYLSFRLYTSLLWVAVIGGCLYLGYATPYFNELIAQVGFLSKLQESVGNLLPGALALIAAAIVLFLHRHIVIIATAGTGAHLISSVTPYPILFFPLFLVGAAIQIGVQRKRQPSKSEEED
ncbi:MAG: DUF4203 domain-containing protein [bacterium]